jgi:hypothetical protein
VDDFTHDDPLLVVARAAAIRRDAMKRLVLMLALLASGFAAGAAHANPASFGFKQVLGAMGSTVTIPPEWAGIWSELDSTYTCQGAFKSTSTLTDTLCSGKDYLSGGDLAFVCTGTANATSVDITCTASFAVATDCAADYSIHLTGTLSSGTYRSVTMTNVTYVGTGTECSLLPPTCTQVNSWGTRTAAVPPNFCTTPTRNRTWGQLKSIYR